jgi:hypothetical protein
MSVSKSGHVISYHGESKDSSSLEHLSEVYGVVITGLSIWYGVRTTCLVSSNF